MTSHEMLVLGPDEIEFYQLATRKAALSLEIKGLRHSSGRSVYALCKRAYGLKGSPARVLASMQALVDAAIQRRHG